MCTCIYLSGREDLSALSFVVPNDLKLGGYNPIELDVGLVIDEPWPASDWPHFQISIYISVDKELDPDKDYNVQYRETANQIYKTSQEIASDITLTLDDPGRILVVHTVKPLTMSNWQLRIRPH